MRERYMVCLWPITMDTDNTVSQSKLEANARSRRKARENLCKRATIGFAFTSGWNKMWRGIFKAILRNTEPNQMRATCDPEIKTTLCLQLMY